MNIGASLWATAIQTSESGAAITKTRHIGCRWGYASLVYETDSQMFPQAKATGLTVKDWQDIIMVNQFGKRFWDEGDELLQVLQRRDGLQRRQEEAERRRTDLGDLRRRRGGAREVESQAAACRSGRLLRQRRHACRARGKIKSQYQKQPMPGAALTETVARYNSFVDGGADKDFKKKTPMHKIEKPPFYAAWATPILHDTLTGLRTNTNSQVMDMNGEVIAGPLQRG